MEKKREYLLYEQGLLFDPVVTVRDVLRKWFLVVVLTVFFGDALLALVQ